MKAKVMLVFLLTNRNVILFIHRHVGFYNKSSYEIKL